MPHVPGDNDAPNSAVNAWERAILAHLRDHVVADIAHDMGHLTRVLSMARRIAAAEGPHDRLVLTAASLLHDCVSVPKDSPLRSRASALAADEAVRLLSVMGFPVTSLDAVHHAVEAHSYSAGIEPRTLEAMVVQDADRIEALGAIGVARCFAVTGVIGRPLFDPEDPLATGRLLDDAAWGLDHFQVKLLRLPATMRTVTGREIAMGRASFVREFMQRIGEECANSGGAPT